MTVSAWSFSRPGPRCAAPRRHGRAQLRRGCLRPRDTGRDRRVAAEPRPPHDHRRARRLVRSSLAVRADSRRPSSHLVEKLAMPAIDDLSAIRRLLDVPHPTDSVTAAGRGRLDELIRHEGSPRRPSRATRGATTARGRRIGIFATAISVAAAAAAAATLTLVHPGSAPPSAAQHVNTLQTRAAATMPGSTRRVVSSPRPRAICWTKATCARPT